MPSLNKRQLRQDMREAVRGEVDLLWPEIRDYIEAENRKLIETFKMIELLQEDHRIDQQTALTLLEGQKISRAAMLETAAGMTTIMIERTLNAALDAVRDTVNTILDFELL